MLTEIKISLEEKNGNKNVGRKKDLIVTHRERAFIRVFSPPILLFVFFSRFPTFDLENDWQMRDEQL